MEVIDDHTKYEKDKARKRGRSLLGKTEELGELCRTLAGAFYWDPTHHELVGVLHLPPGQTLPELDNFYRRLAAAGNRARHRVHPTTRRRGRRNVPVRDEIVVEGTDSPGSDDVDRTPDDQAAQGTAADVREDENDAVTIQHATGGATLPESSSTGGGSHDAVSHEAVSHEAVSHEAVSHEAVSHDEPLNDMPLRDMGMTASGPGVDESMWMAMDMPEDRGSWPDVDTLMLGADTGHITVAEASPAARGHEEVQDGVSHEEVARADITKQLQEVAQAPSDRGGEAGPPANDVPMFNGLGDDGRQASGGLAFDLGPHIGSGLSIATSGRLPTVKEIMAPKVLRILQDIEARSRARRQRLKLRRCLDTLPSISSQNSRNIFTT